ncbi:MAG: hypothetical protein GY761_05420 [Hyphomicrobiales bacterium]|nr:hypothetical protein [Hyphomicrobiales bacterium]
MERRSGMVIFERLSEGMRPTSVGIKLLGVAAQIETPLSEFSETLDALHGGEFGNVRVGVVSTAEYFAPRVLSGFLKEHPTVNIRLQVENCNDFGTYCSG